MPAPVASSWSDLAGWALHPLESAAFSRRTPKWVIRDDAVEMAGLGGDLPFRIYPAREALVS